MLDPKNLATGDILEALQTEYLDRPPYTTIWTAGRYYCAAAIAPNLQFPELTKFDIDDDSGGRGVQTVAEVGARFRNVTAEEIARRPTAKAGSAQSANDQ